jgi:hypothetical protein
MAHGMLSNLRFWFVDATKKDKMKNQHGGSMLEFSLHESVALILQNHYILWPY